MTQKKKIFFAIFFLLCLIEPAIHLSSIISGVQPRRWRGPLYYLQVSPAALVYDRYEGFYRTKTANLHYEDGAFVPFTYSETEENPSNFMERLLLRKIFSYSGNERLVRYYFCDKKLKTLKLREGHQLQKIEIYDNNDKTFNVVVKC